MSLARVDERLMDWFTQAKQSASDVQSSHGVAASINSDVTQELLKELPSVGPVTYLPELEVVLADVERTGFDYLVEHQDVHAISDAELRFDVPTPLDVDEQSYRTTREVVRGTTALFDGYEGKGITVAVMDTGVYAEHPCFSGRVTDQISCVDGSYSVGDVHGHGTHVAGSVAGEDIGVASEASVLDLRVFGPGGGASTSSILKALDLCIQRNVDIVNMSLGSTYPSRVLDGAVDSVARAGVLACVAAGNSGPYASTINSPASAQLALAVAANDARGNVASFSSRGPNPWFAWPKPDVSSFGVDVQSASHRGGHAIMSGTSMATPAVAGVLACVLEHQSEHPDAKFIAESLIKDAAQNQGQSFNEVGHGVVTLRHVEAYLTSASGVQQLKNKKGTTTPRNFFRESVLKCTSCPTERTIHQIAHRSDDTMRIQLSCRTGRKVDEKGNPVYDDVVLENWKHRRISDKQFIRALRLCGGCGKRGMVPIESTKIDLDKKHHDHTKVMVGCLYCNGKGIRKIPTRLLEAWTS